MPQIAMPEKEPPPPQVIPDSGNKSDKEIIEKIQTDIAEEDYDEDSLIEVTERLIPEEDDVFAERPVPQIKPIVQEEEEALPPTEQESSSEFKPTGKRAYKRKAPMSQKQKDHLARIRKIASEKRAKEREDKAQDKIKKEEEKEEARVRKAEERILAKQRKEQEQVNEPKPARAPTPSVPQTGFTRDDMERAMFSAISSYETIRKREKEDKKKRQLAEAREDQMKRTLQRAIQPDKPVDQWRQFFN